MPSGGYSRFGQDLGGWREIDHFISYDPQLDQADIDWWSEEISRRMGEGTFTPGIVAQALLGLFPCETQNCKATIRRARNLVDLEITGTFEGGGTWISAQQINFSENALWKGLVLLPDDRQGQGLSKLLMRNCYEVARGLRLSTLRLHAMEVGSYAWLRYGFKPDAADWIATMKTDIGARLGELLGAGLVARATADRVFRSLAVDDPAIAIAVAAERELVPSLQRDSKGGPVWIPLGRALLAEANHGRGTSWRGSLNLDDPGMMSIFLDYTRSGT
jgi:GNAT superfamily N-acetyltransferase